MSDEEAKHATEAMVDMLQPWSHKAFLVFHQMSKEHGSQYAIGWFDCYAAVVRAT